MVATSSTSTSLKEYLKKYTSNDDVEKKKKKRKRNTKPDNAGVLVVDEDPVWQKPVKPEEEEDSADEEKPQVDEDIDVKRMRRLEQLKSRRPYGAISEDGSGWVPVSDMSNNVKSEDLNSDISPRRRRNDTPSPRPEEQPDFLPDADLSPPRQRRRQSPPQSETKRKARYDTPSPDPHRENSESNRLVTDLSPPRRQRRDKHTLSPEPDRRSSYSKSTNSDISPPRRGHRDSKYQDSTRDLSPPRKVKNDRSDSVLSSRKSNHKLDGHESADHARSVTDLSPPRRRKGSPVLVHRPKTGLVSGGDVKEEIDKKKKEDWSRFQKMDPSVSGRDAEAIYRNKKTGERMSREEFLELKKTEKKKYEKPKEIKLEWGKGLAQKREAETRLQEIEAEKDKPFARSSKSEMANTRIIDDGERNDREWPFGGYVTLPTSALPELPPFHYDTVVVDGRVTQRTDWSEIPEIVRMLRPEHWRIINDYPQIGSFLRLTGNGKFKASVLHNMILRVCVRLQRKSRYEYWFLVNGKPVRFGAEEFSLVSGLRFRRVSDADSESIDQGSNLKNRYFAKWGQEEVSVHVLKTRIIELLGRNNANHEAVCKLIFAWVISALLVPIRPMKVVQNKTFAICDDLAICERYPWGEKLWSQTLDEIVTHMSCGADNIRRWNAGGFPHILLFWMLEAIEGMPDAGNFSPRHGPAIPRHPRMLRWDIGGGNWPNCFAMDKFFKDVHAVIPRLRPDDTELEMEYYISARELSEGVRPDSRVPSYCRLTEFFGELYVVVRDDEGAPEFLNRPPALTDSAPEEGAAPDADAPDSAHVRRRLKRVRRSQDGASTSQAQPQPSSSEPRYEDVPAWARDMEQRLTDHQNQMMQSLRDQQNEIDHRLTGQLDSMQVTLEKLHRMMLEAREARGVNVGDDDDSDDDDDNQGDHLCRSERTHSEGNNAEDNCLHGDLEVMIIWVGVNQGKKKRR